MNKVRHEVRQKKFRQIKEAISKLEYVQKAFTKINGELRWVIEEKWKIPPQKIEEFRKKIPPAFLEATRDIKPPTGWRKNVLCLIYKTDLKAAHPQSFRDGDGCFNFGKLVGLAGDYEHEMQKPEHDPDLVERFNKIVTPLLIRDQDIPQAEKGIEIMNKAIEQVPTRSREEQKRYYSGLANGTNSLFSEGSHHTERHCSTEIYYDLLVLDEYLECLHTRKQLYQFLAYFRGEKEVGRFSSFEKLCQNIEYLTPSQIRKKKTAQGKTATATF